MNLNTNINKYKNKLTNRATCFLINQDQILLGQKKEGIGKDKFVGIGGKQKDDESLKETVEREINEEIGVIPINFRKVATLDFYFLENKDWNMRIYVHLCDKWKGEIKETEEIKPEWFKVSEIPFDKMWEDALFYLPFVVREKIVEGEFLYNKNEKVIDSKVKIRQKI